ncbi:TPA: hypothetical protein DIU27_03025 [Candidatus Collierbacteria bacterium]|uniref:Uncharacterized protein n=1 Tax=Candidatus Collierbacteria bacterium GW2011_GWB2_44_22 TaxID=1618387 RepID=A0A0G1K573_9BACT|nr:MAG: hypothetical protein UW31_C0003G0013 [Candidatus Collierbacteria bacterium GW2011_GWA2_44_13]KKT50404.1 MAG: hypothetical protein UW42_C0019G0006 [Candidatus Collierbacteria bacterium GW2011_GWB1_44_197]KKT51442.1 MAG: hypothetical protein UW44_C0012G0025 [Candidatus Collierbacteria bacterium GW2011_GWB2_44_22]KKT61530.1 MAG: hypothetical protein UW56_C0024G0010 [Candidatus Collierbacteria bacterium GW2011_GWD1_44_27]KKT65763.1 MAG: hypothetical protein UW58_C0020G0013 [Candidatus Colli
MKEKNKVTKVKIKQDRLLRVSQTKNDLGDYVGDNWPQEMLISGNLQLGKSGNPVTIFLEDEVTGEQLEISGVKNAFLILEDTRRTSSGWLALAVGSIEKVGDVLGFLSQTTLDTIRKLTK